jgi:hypothetical protein
MADRWNEIKSLETNSSFDEYFSHMTEDEMHEALKAALVERNKDDEKLASLRKKVELSEARIASLCEFVKLSEKAKKSEKETATLREVVKLAENARLPGEEAATLREKVRLAEEQLKLVQEQTATLREQVKMVQD